MVAAINAIFMDIGGTLLTNDGNPYVVDGTDLNVKVLRELTAAGLSFSMLTGLPPELLRKAALEPYLTLADYVVIENGSAIYRRKGQTLSFDPESVDAQWRERIRKASEGLDSIVAVLSRENVAYKRFEHSVRVYNATAQLADGRAKGVLSDIPETIQLRRYKADLIFCPAMATKGEALRFIAAQEAWDLSSIMAIGNEMVDQSMLRIVGYPRATQNSPEELKQLVHRLGGEVSEYPAGKAVYHFMLSVNRV